ncbi:MAG: RnfH family protein [Betaproteobacteria bacterium]|nr:RnfH family protein [Betaproteobacteria bacterium]
MRILVVAALATRQEVISLDVPEGTTAGEAIALAGVTGRFPELAGAEAGLWGRAVTPARVLREGDRVELLRPVSADAKSMRRERAALRPSRRSRTGP